MIFSKENSAFDEESTFDSTLYTSTHRISSSTVSYGNLFLTDSDYYQMTPGSGEFELVVSTEGLGGKTNDKFTVLITDFSGNVYASAQGSGPDVYTNSLSFVSSGNFTYYIKIAPVGRNETTINYAATLNYIGTKEQAQSTLLLPGYSLQAVTESIDEGKIAQFTVTTANVPAGTWLSYKISNVSSNDLVGGSLSGSVQIDASGQGTISIPIAADSDTEGDDTIIVDMQGQRATMKINDTSTAPILIAPTIALSSNVSSLTEGQTATIAFTLSEASTNFTQSDVTVSGGTLSNFSGSGTNYSATFTPTVNSTTSGVISVASGTFSSSAGKLNTDGADANNRVTLTVNTVPLVTDAIPPTITLFSPADGATGVDVASNVFLTFSEAIARGTGTIEIRSGSASGVLVESFNAATSNRVTLSDNQLTIDPTNNLGNSTRYFVVVNSGTIKDTAGNSYAGTSTFDFTTASLAAVNVAPTGSVSIYGTSTQGQTLTASNTLADADGIGTITYTWKANGTTIGTGSTYTLTQAAVGKTITVTAGYTDGGGTTESVTSSATATVANVNDLPTGTVSITGTVSKDQVLTASNNLADADGLGTITYTWKANGITIGTGTTYTLTQAEVGKTITATATYTDGYGNPESVASNATSTVTAVNSAPTGVVVITGTFKQGQTLAASNTLADTDGLGSITYTWKANGAAVGTGATYTLTQAEVGKSMTVTASYTDGGGTSESINSSATAAVTSDGSVPDDGVIRGRIGPDLLEGGSGNDVFQGNGGIDRFNITAGVDSVLDLGKGGADVLNVSAGATVDATIVAKWIASAATVNYGTANLSTNGFAVNLAAVTAGNGFNVTNVLTKKIVLTGSELSDSLTGNIGKDKLIGNAGGDTLIGTEGADKMTGGLGSDKFVFSAGDSGQAIGFDIVLDYTKGQVGVGDVIDYSANLAIGGTEVAATSTQASINSTTGVASFAPKSGSSIADALADISAGFSSAGDLAGNFALFQVKAVGNYYLFISDGIAGVSTGDVVVRLVGVTSIGSIDLTDGNLTIVA